MSTIGLREERRKCKVISLIFFLFFLILLLNYFHDSVEALTIVRLTILPPIAVELNIYIDGDLCNPSMLKEFCLGQTMKANSSLENVGSENITGNLSMTILNRSSHVIKQETWYNMNLSFGETKDYEMNYTIRDEDEAGRDYWIESNFTYDNDSIVERCEFRVKKGIGYLRVSPDEIVDTLPPGRSENYTINLWLRYPCENTTVLMNASEGRPGNWTSFDPEQVFLKSTGQTNLTIVNITVPVGTSYDSYVGTIFANADSQRVPIDLNITVSPLYLDVKTMIPEQWKSVCPGEKVYANVNVTKYYPPEEISVNMTYRTILNGEVIAELKEPINVTNSTIRVIGLSSNGVGSYEFLSILEFNETEFRSSDTFEVISCPTPPPPGPGPGPGPAPAPAPPPEFGLTLNLSTDLLSVIAGNRTSFVATVENVGTEKVKSVKISIEGIHQAWLGILPESVDILPKGTQGFLVMINVPIQAETGVYELKVKATDEVESNVEILKLIVGRNLKEIADLLLKELEALRTEAERSLLVEECIDVTLMKTMHQNAELAFKEGKEEYDNKNYIRAINWFEYAISVEKRVVNKIDINLEMEIETSKKSKFIIPPFYNPDEQFLLAETYLTEKNYEEICDPIEDIRKFIVIGLVFWPGILILAIVLIFTTIILYRKKRRRERVRLVEEVKERLGFSGTESDETHEVSE